MLITLDAKRRFSLPASFAPTKPGDQFEAVFDSEDDLIILRRVPPKRNWLEVWKKCPVPMDDVPPRSRSRVKPVETLKGAPYFNWRVMTSSSGRSVPPSSAQ